MGGRDVNLNIKVSGQRDLDSATASVERLKAAAAGNKTDYGLRQTRGDMAGSDEERMRRVAAFLGRDMPQAANQAETAVGAVTSATSGSSVAFGVLSAAGGVLVGALAAVAAAILVVVGVGVTLAAAITRVTKDFADYAIEIGNVAEANSLAAETVSALRHEAEAQGRSFGVVESAASAFRKTIGEANAGSKAALASIKALGIDGKTAMYDVDGAFKQAIATIVKAPNEIEQARLAFAAFGDDGAKILPFLRELGGGDVDRAIEKARQLGIVVSGENVDAARNFNRAYEDVKKQILAVTYAFGSEFLPVVADVMRSFSGWLESNRGTMNRFADGAKIMGTDVISALSSIKKWIEENKEIFSYLEYIPWVAAAKWAGTKIGQYYGSRVNESPVAASMGGSAMVADDGVLGAKFSYKPKKEKETEAEKQAKYLRELLGQLNRELDYFGDKSRVAAVSQQMLAQNVDITNNAVAKQILNVAANIDKKEKEAEAAKKAAEEAKKYRELLDKTRADVDNAAINERIGIGGNIKELEQRIALGRELNVVEKAKLDLQIKLTQAEATGFPGLKSDDKDSLIAKMRVEGEETIKRLERVLELLNKIDEIEKGKARDKAFKEYSQSLEDQLDAVRRGNEPLSVYEQTMRELSRDYKDLKPEQKQHLLDLSEQIDLVTELNRQHAELKAFLKDGLRYAFEGNFSGLLQSWGDQLKDNLADKLSDIFATNLLGFDPKKTNNPVARPIVDKLDETNKILRGIAVGSGGGAPSTASGSGGGIIGKILGAFGIGGGPGGTPQFNPDGTISYDGSSQIQNTIGLRGGGTYSTGRSIWSQIFGAGGIFGDKGFGNNVGTYGAIGGLASIVGGMLGGRVGGLISGAGSGLGMGAQIGSLFGPGGTAIGAAVGAVAGGLIGLLSNLFGRNAQRRRDEQTRNQGMLDAQAAIKSQFDALSTQVRFGQIDPASAITRGTAIGDQVRAQYLQMANSLQDSKTRRIAIADVSRVDSLIAQKMAELRGLTEVAQGSADRMKRILPEFAGGHYFADFFRPNGLLPGMFDGRDDILAKISRGEMVLNPSQIANVRRAAGFDVFAGAGIPNYPKANPSSHLATGGIVGGSGLGGSAANVVVRPQFTMVVEGATFDEKTKAYLVSDDGSKTFVDVYKKKKKSGDIS